MTASSDRPLTVVGNPNSAGSYAAGQDLAPTALRTAGLLDLLAADGRAVTDAGDLAHQPWRADPQHPLAQNWPDVVANLLELRDRIVTALRAGTDVLVLGGNCTGALAAVAALRDETREAPGLLYIDRHLDANTPRSVRDGALDWMGMAHALALPDTVDQLVDAFGPRPLLTAAQIVYLGVDQQHCTAWELEQIGRLGIPRHSLASLADDPPGAAAAALGDLPAGPVVVNVDVDVLDFTDAPLSEDTNGRNTGPTLDQLGRALTVAVRDARTRVLCVSELNPTRSAADPGVLHRFAATIASALHDSR